MKFLKENWHWGVTIIWIGFVGYLWQYSGIEKPEQLNGIGDFLAGAFAPMAFFWLVRGFYQQGEGLRQNSIALSMQADELKTSSEALLMQVKEMQASVDQQKQMAELQQMEIEERHNAVYPIVDVVTGINSRTNGEIEISFTIRNTENLVAKFLVLKTNCSDSIHESGIFKVDFLNREAKAFREKLTEQEEKIYKSRGSFSRNIELSFENIYGRKYVQYYLLEVSNHSFTNQTMITRIS